MEKYIDLLVIRIRCRLEDGNFFRGKGDRERERDREKDSQREGERERQR